MNPQTPTTEYKIVHTKEGAVIIDESTVQYFSNSDICNDPKKFCDGTEDYDIVATVSPYTIEGIPCITLPAYERLGAEEILDKMEDKMPYALHDQILPYILEAMELYANQPAEHISDQLLNKKITEIIYKNSTDDSEYLRIPFEKIHDVIELLTEALSTHQGYSESDIFKAIKFGFLSKESGDKIAEKKGVSMTELTKQFISSLKPTPKSITLNPSMEVVEVKY